MNKFRIAFATTGVVFLLVLAVAPLKDYFREWRGYQNEYNELVERLPQRMKPVDVGIQQRWVRKLDRVDRCETCHLGINRPELEDAPQPFRTHPLMHHDVDEFGCTICHDGQGSATTVEDAHGYVEHWDAPMLPQGLMEASCGKCHTESDVDEAPILSAGRKLLERSNCVGCHAIEGIRKRWVPGLDGIGSKVSRDWLVRWLKNPKSYDAGTAMPDFLLSDEEVDVLADFLMTFKTFPANAHLLRIPASLEDPSAQPDLIQLGATRFREARCISCHAINERGGTTAPELGMVASKVSPEWLFSYIQNPKRLQPGVEMPRYGFSDRELTAIVAYMETEFIDYGAEEPGEHTPDPGFYEKGVELVRKYNCTGCHTLTGITGAEIMGPDLTSIGSKKPYEIDFGTSGIDKTLPAYLVTKLMTPRVILPTMKMPDYHFTDEQVQALVVALLSMTNDPIPSALLIRPPAQTEFRPQGAFGKVLDEFACLGCHVIRGDGREIGPDLTIEASQVTPTWLKAYFKVPYSLRPILTERMPNLFIPDEKIRTIVDYLETVFLADSVETIIPQDKGSIKEGKDLFESVYGCQSCHQVNLEGGYVGPALDHVGSRLRPGWMYSWLKGPRRFKPNTIEPDFGLSDLHAKQLVAYLSSLR